MNLAQMIARARVRREAGFFPAEVWLRLIDDENPEPLIAAELAAGRIGPRTKINFIVRRIVESTMECTA
jgi:hypothetical protein